MTGAGANERGQSFSELYRAHAGDVRRFALYLSGNSALADDIVSETFVRVWNAGSRVDLTTVKAYLLTIARNLYLHHLRRERRRTDLDDRLADPGPDPHERAHARGELDAVMAALMELPEIDRAAVLMRAHDELSYAEIARALGMSESAAKVRVHRARLKLAAARQPAPPVESMEKNR